MNAVINNDNTAQSFYFCTTEVSQQGRSTKESRTVKVHVHTSQQFYNHKTFSKNTVQKTTNVKK